jgi:UDP-apiose/xylose synthase
MKEVRYMQVRRLVVLGCGGFIGSHFLDRLLAEPEVEVVGWDPACSRIEHLLDHPRFTLRQESVGPNATGTQLEQDIAASDWVINLAAICNPSLYNTDPLRTISANFMEGISIVELATKYHKPLLFLSTSEVYGRTPASLLSKAHDDPKLWIIDAETTPMIMGPTTAQRWTYATAKQLHERLIYAYHKEHGLDFAIVRPFNFFGPRMDYLPGIEGEGKPRVLAMFVGAMLTGDPLRLVGGGHARRTITSIHDAIDALMAIINRPNRSLNTFYNIANPANEVSMAELAELVRSTFLKITGEARFAEHPIVDVTGRDVYGEGYEDSDRRLPTIEREMAQLDWAPTRSLQEVVDETVKYYWQKYGDRRAKVA